MLLRRLAAGIAAILVAGPSAHADVGQRLGQRSHATPTILLFAGTSEVTADQCRSTRTFGGGPSWKAEVWWDTGWNRVVDRVDNLKPAKFDPALIERVSSAFHYGSFRVEVLYRSVLPTRQLDADVSIDGVAKKLAATDESEILGGPSGAHRIQLEPALSLELFAALEQGRPVHLAFFDQGQKVLELDLDAPAFAEAAAYLKSEEVRLASIGPKCPRPGDGGGGGGFFVPF